MKKFTLIFKLRSNILRQFSCYKHLTVLAGSLLLVGFFSFFLFAFTKSDGNQMKGALAAGDTLMALKTINAPVVDGVVDPIWNNVPEMTIALGETYDVHDPASITNCSGCHAFNSAYTLKLKAVYTTSQVYFLAVWTDSTASFTRDASWSFATGVWAKPHTGESEDRISFYWPIGATTGTYSTGGCMTKCHMYYPTDQDPHVSVNGIVDDAWLLTGRADLWHSKAARGGAVTSASGTGLTINSTSHEVTGGTFSMIGYVDDTYADVWSGTNGEDGGRYPDAGTAAASHNRISDKSRPKWMEKNPTDFADAMFITQTEIDAGECVGNATTGVSDSLAAIYWPNYTSLNAIVCERILAVPTGSRGDLAIGAVWNGSTKTWTAEISRNLITGNADDVQFNSALDTGYTFNVATFENSRHGYEHRTSQSYKFKLSTTYVGIENLTDLNTTFNLAQNYPNPFNKNTKISYTLDGNSYVQIDIYNIFGKKIKELVNKYQEAGSYEINFDGTNIPVGTYFYKIKAGKFTSEKKMLIVR